MRFCFILYMYISSCNVTKILLTKSHYALFRLRKTRLRKVKNSSRVNGGKAKAWIQDFLSPNSRLSTANLYVVLMLPMVSPGWNYSSWLWYLQSIFFFFFGAQHMSYPASQYRFFFPVQTLITNDRAIIYKQQSVFWGFPFKGLAPRGRLLKMQSVHRAAFASATAHLLPPWPPGPWGHVTSSHQQNPSGSKIGPFPAEEFPAGFPKFSLFPAFWLDAANPGRLPGPEKMCRHLMAV